MLEQSSVGINLYYLVIGVFKIFGLLPLLWIQNISRCLGAVLLKINKRPINRIKQNLDHCFPALPPEEKSKILQQRLMCMSQTIFEMSYVWTKPEKELQAKITAEHNESFRQAIDANESIIILGLHIGNFEVLSVYLSKLRQLSTLYRPFKDEKFDLYIRQARERTGAKFYPNNTHGIRTAYKDLAQKGMFLVAPDHVPGKGLAGIFAPLFNQPAFTTTLPQRLALKTKAKVFMAAAYQNKGGFHIIIEPVAEEFYQPDEYISACAMNKQIEQFVLRDLAQSQLEYKRYRTQPQGQSSPYK
ncbi:lysophospholipid acyltransferase family protein [Thalassotalea agariperforans]